ncbi:hypothetical protein L3X38_042012 [Prunus dulcis]|uniref:Uncharacterized protein n=1 Tax=Prunus dulcis TaxID=3755 RepID=A0AAD4UV38_PRUDU|nr:hypothetical protein L3X38_042012 [Prunus dulcis]
MGGKLPPTLKTGRATEHTGSSKHPSSGSAIKAKLEPSRRRSSLSAILLSVRQTSLSAKPLSQPHLSQPLLLSVATFHSRRRHTASSVLQQFADPAPAVRRSSILVAADSSGFSLIPAAAATSFAHHAHADFLLPFYLCTVPATIPGTSLTLPYRELTIFGLGMELERHSRSRTSIILFSLSIFKPGREPPTEADERPDFLSLEQTVLAVHVLSVYK